MLYICIQVQIPQVYISFHVSINSTIAFPGYWYHLSMYARNRWSLVTDWSLRIAERKKGTVDG